MRVTVIEANGRFTRFRDAKDWRQVHGELTIVGAHDEAVMVYLSGEWQSVGHMQSADEVVDGGWAHISSSGTPT